MAEIIPFRGVHYHPGKIKDMARVVAPPFDVISKTQQNDLHEIDPHNVVRLTLGKKFDTDGPAENAHTRAAAYLEKWLQEGILVRDNTPTIYLTATSFDIEGRAYTRYGLIALVGLEPFEKNVVLPHEKTFSGVKTERLELMKACRANLSPIWSLYSDAENRILDRCVSAAKNLKPDFDFVDAGGQGHRLWRLTDTDILRFVSKSFSDKRLYIADGHHRYETALAYRQFASERTSNFTPQDSANFVMMYLTCMEDPAVIILPAHRLLKSLPEDNCRRLLETAPKYFRVQRFPFSDTDRTQAENDFFSALNGTKHTNALGAVMRGLNEFLLLTNKNGSMEAFFGDSLPPAYRQIDVTVLTHLVMTEILQFDQARLDNWDLIGYTSIASEAVESVIRRECDIAFVLNPTKIEQVRQIADQGLVMPRKATYFYPKVTTGLVLNKHE